MQGLSHGTYTSRATVKLRDICCTVEGSLTTAHIETHSPLYMCSVALPDSRASHSGKEVQEKCGSKHASLPHQYLTTLLTTEELQQAEACCVGHHLLQHSYHSYSPNRK